MNARSGGLVAFLLCGLLLGIALAIAPWTVEFVPTQSKLILSIAGILMLGVFGILVIITRLYIKASADEAFVRTGVGGRRCIIDGGSLVIPVVHQIVRVSLRTFKLVVKRSGGEALITSDCLRADVEAVFYVRVKKEQQAIEQAATSLGVAGDNLGKVEELIQEKLISALRTVAAKQTLAALNTNLADFASAVEQIVARDLEPNGLTLESVTISKLDQASLSTMRPDDNVFDAQGARTLAEQVQAQRVQRNNLQREADRKVKETDVQTAQFIANKEVEQAQALAEAEARKKIAQAEQGARAASVQADQERVAQTAQVEAGRLVDLAKVEKTKAVQVAEQERDRATEVAQVEKIKAVEVANRQRQVAIAQAEKDRADAEALQLEAQREREAKAQQVTTTEVTMTAERDKQKAIIAKQAEAEQRRIAQQVEADVQAYTAVKQAEGEQQAADNRAKARVALATAARDAKALEAEGDRAVQIVPVQVQAEQVKVNDAQVTVDIRRLEGQAKNEKIALDLQIALAEIEARKQAQIAMAQAFGDALSKANLNVWGDPTTVTKMMTAFTTGQQAGAFTGGLAGALPDGISDLVKRFTGVDLSAASPLAPAKNSQGSQTEQS